MDADKLKQSVESQLDYDPRIDGSKIEVSASELGVITLAGTVGTYLERFEAEAAAKRVYGVRAVANEIQVRPLGEPTRNDAEIAESAVNSLRWLVALPEERIKVTVSDGWVSLDGDVDYYFQKKEAERAVRNLVGVVGVTNHLRIKPRAAPDPEKIRRDIEAAMVRSARLDARGIHVRTEGSRVVLEGSVRSWSEAEEAEDAAWAASGVSEVDSRIQVAP